MNNMSMESALPSVGRAPESVRTNGAPMKSDPSLVARADDAAFKNDLPKAKSIADALPTVHLPEAAAKITARNINFYYGETRTLKDVSLVIREKRVTALIGPSGCGKSTLLRIFNRMYAIYPKQRAEGEILLDGENVLGPRYSINRLRTKVGMVFQKPVPFPMSIYDNVAYALRHYEICRARRWTRESRSP